MQLLANSFIENEESVLQFCNHIKLQPNIYLLTQLNTKYKHKLMLKDPLKDIQMSLKNIVYKTYWNDNTVFSFPCPVNLINMKFTKSFHLLLNVINFIQPSHINIMPAAKCSVKSTPENNFAVQQRNKNGKSKPKY